MEALFGKSFGSKQQFIPATCGSGFWGALIFFAFLAGKYTGGGTAAEPRQY
jgi:hypothetical protein